MLNKIGKGEAGKVRGLKLVVAALVVAASGAVAVAPAAPAIANTGGQARPNQVCILNQTTVCPGP
jgi:hypothetical protein